MAITRCPATKPTASSTASCTDAACACDCHPAKSVPSYSTIAATRRESARAAPPAAGAYPPIAARSTLAGQRLYETRGFLFLAGGSFLHNLFENAACPFRVAHIHVCPGKVELRAHFAHRHRLHFRYRKIHGFQLVGLRLELVGRTI